MKVGDYVRTDIGEIRKVVRVTDDLYVLDKDIVFAHEDKIKISSPNIIDLIEVGDYVNNEKIVDIGCLTNGPEKGTKVIDYYIAPNTVYYLKNEDIKSIVTKEQIENIEYEVK